MTDVDTSVTVDQLLAAAVRDVRRDFEASACIFLQLSLDARFQRLLAHAQRLRDLIATVETLTGMDLHELHARVQNLPAFADLRVKYTATVRALYGAWVDDAATQADARFKTLRDPGSLLLNLYEDPDRALRARRAAVVARLKALGGIETDSLDEVVHEHAAAEAARINNEGVEAQVAYLPIEDVEHLAAALERTASA